MDTQDPVHVATNLQPNFLQAAESLTTTTTVQMLARCSSCFSMQSKGAQRQAGLGSLWASPSGDFPLSGTLRGRVACLGNEKHGQTVHGLVVIIELLGKQVSNLGLKFFIQKQREVREITSKTPVQLHRVNPFNNYLLRVNCVMGIK